MAPGGSRTLGRPATSGTSMVGSGLLNRDRRPNRVMRCRSPDFRSADGCCCCARFRVRRMSMWRARCGTARGVNSRPVVASVSCADQFGVAASGGGAHGDDAVGGAPRTRPHQRRHLPASPIRRDSRTGPGRHRRTRGGGASQLALRREQTGSWWAARSRGTTGSDAAGRGTTCIAVPGMDTAGACSVLEAVLPEVTHEHRALPVELVAIGVGPGAERVMGQVFVAEPVVLGDF